MTTYYVSAQGNDSAAGTSTSTAFASLARAVQAMGSSSSGDVTYVMDGTYKLTAPLTLTGNNSGDTIAAYQNANPVVSGGTTVSGWTAGANGIWSAKVGSVAEVQQFVVDGARQVEARYPNYDASDPIKGGWLWAKDVPSGHDAAHEMAYNKADFPGGQPMVGEKVTVFSQLGYSSDVLTIASVDTNAGIIRFAEEATYDIGSGSRYFVSGSQPRLDQAGEWWFDKASHTLYYKAPAGFDGSDAVVSSDMTLVNVQNASNIAIKGLTFSDAATREATDDIDTAAIKVSGSSSNITLDGNHFVNVAKGVLVDGTSHHVTVANSDFNHIWAAAIDLRPGTHETTVTNNHITHSGEVFRTSGAVQMAETWGNTISHNLIQDVPRFAIGETNWDSGMKSGSNVIEYNEIARSGQETPDVGAIYIYSGGDPGSVGDIIRYNTINDAGGLGTNANGFINGRYMSAGIYLDDFASNSQIYGNFVKGTWFGGVYLHGGANNDVWGNTLVDNVEVGIQLFPIDGKSMAGTKIHGNIVTLPTHNGENVLDVNPSLLNPRDIHDNIYVGNASNALFEGKSLASWQGSGGDIGSTIVADPGFANAAGGDYSLKGGAYALSHGYKQLPWSDIGMTSDVSATPAPTPTPTPDPTPELTPDPVVDPTPTVPTDGHVFNGTTGNDTLVGSSGIDTINGGNGNDLIHGLGGNDVLTGGAGFDRFYFETALDGANNVDTVKDFVPMTDEIWLSKAIFAALPGGELSADAFYAGAKAHDASDRIIYNPATGDVLYDSDGNGSAAAVTFAKLAPNLNVTHNDFYVTTEKAAAPAPTPEPTPTPTPTPTPNPAPSAGGQTLNGTSRADTLKGGTGNDTISGGAGNDHFYGKAGNDTLTGGAGQDRFYFDTTLNGTTNVDTIKDFMPMTDEMWLAKAVFKALPAGELSASAFYAGADAHASSDRILYNSNTGQVFYDSDGTGPAAKVQFAQISPHLNITHNDFYVI
jgi:parallel beta-helix repeat protein